MRFLAQYLIRWEPDDKSGLREWVRHLIGRTFTRATMRAVLELANDDNGLQSLLGQAIEVLFACVPRVGEHLVALASDGQEERRVRFHALLLVGVLRLVHIGPVVREQFNLFAEDGLGEAADWVLESLGSE